MANSSIPVTASAKREMKRILDSLPDRVPDGLPEDEVIHLFISEEQVAQTLYSEYIDYCFDNLQNNSVLSYSEWLLYSKN